MQEIPTSVFPGPESRYRASSPSRAARTAGTLSSVRSMCPVTARAVTLSPSVDGLVAGPGSYRGPWLTG